MKRKNDWIVKLRNRLTGFKERYKTLRQNNLSEVVLYLSKKNFYKLSQVFLKSNEKLCFIDFLRTMSTIVDQPKCKLKFIKNLIELFNNIDVDSNLVLEWEELLMYILENQQFLDPRLVEGINEEDKIEILYSHKSDYTIRFDKKNRLNLGRQSNLSMSHFHDSGKSYKLLLVNPKTCTINVYSNTFYKFRTYE